MRRRATALIVCFLSVAAVTTAQRALDANLNAITGRKNPTNPGVAISRPLYTVNRNSGEMVYNRAVAFNDPTYNIYQRYTINRFDSTGVPKPKGMPSYTGSSIPGAANVSALQQSRRSLRAKSGSAGMKMPTYSTTHRAKSSYSARRVGGLKQPSYRVR